MNEAFIYTLVTLLNIISRFFLLLFSLLELGWWSVRQYACCPFADCVTQIQKQECKCETTKHSLMQRSRDAWVENIICVLCECTCRSDQQQ